jgi:predicted  nucleic acid-binding Zn-ribbon protein
MYQQSDDKVGSYRSKLSSIQNQVTELKRKFFFEDISNALGNLENNLSGISQKIGTIRQKGFIFGKDWERLVNDYKNEFSTIKTTINNESNNISNLHSMTLNQMASEIGSIRANFENSPSNYYSHIDSLESRIAPIKKIIDDAENKLKSMIGPIEKKINRFSNRIVRIDKGYEYLENASFKLLQNEHVVDVWEAQYLKEGNEGPKGVIYLTDKRFRFEQNEDVVVSRKFLFITKKEHRQKLMVDEPIGSIVSSKDSEKGFFLARKEVLNLKFGEGAKLRNASFRTFIDSEEVDNILDSVVSGGITSTMTEEALKKEKEIEEKPLPKIDRCPACGAKFSQPIVKGMTYIKCEYCGKITYF